LLQVNRLDESLAEIGKIRSSVKALDLPLLEVNDVYLSIREALCHMRRGELANCLSNHNADSCLLPLRGGGIYRLRDDSNQATNVLTRLLERYPGNLTARWLLNVAHMTLGGYPGHVPTQWLIPPHVFNSDHDVGRFRDVASGVGLGLTELSGGALVDDFDGDGNLDELTCKKNLWTHSSDALVRRCSIDEGCQPIRLDKRVTVHKSDVIDAIEITHRHVVSGESKILPISNCCDGRESSLNLFKTSVG
jgi:hypothetical protein